jgi:hypothetical protein
MDLEQLVKEVSKLFQDYPKAKVAYNILVGVGSSYFIESIYPVINEETGEQFIVVSNKPFEGEE